MTTLLTKVGLVFLMLETLVGMVANGSIILINFIDWFRSRKLTPIDMILTYLGSFRLLLLVILIVDSTLFTWFQTTLEKVLFMLIALWMFTNTVNLWLAAWLSVFYLAKIAIFSNPIFLQVKQRFSRLLPWLLPGSIVFSALVAIIITPFWKSGLVICSSLKSSSSNRTNAQMNMPHFCTRNLALIVTFDFIPFAVFLSSSIFLITSLWKHVRHVERNGTGTKDLNTQAHRNAIGALASFAVLYLISYAVFTSLSVVIVGNQQSWTVALYNLGTGCPSGHSVILILINPKLKKAWVGMLRCLKCGTRCKI